MEHRSSRRFPWLTRVVPCWLGLLPVTVCAADRPEVPQGYEDAATAKPAPPDAAPAAAAEPQPVRGALMDALMDALQGKDLPGKDDPQVAQLERQFLPQFQRLLKTEQAFVQRVCDLTKEQRAQIDKAGDQCVKATVKAYAAAQNQMRHGRMPQGRSVPAVSDPRQLLQQQMAAVVKSKLRPEQAEQYQQECEKQAAHRKQVGVRMLVAKLDEVLVLTSEQRDKLTASLTANWQDAWGQSLQLLLHNTHYLPSIPDQYVLPVLSETQKAAWRNAFKQGLIVGGVFEVLPGLDFNEDVFGAENQ